MNGRSCRMCMGRTVSSSLPSSACDKGRIKKREKHPEKQAGPGRRMRGECKFGFTGHQINDVGRVACGFCRARAAGLPCVTGVPMAPSARRSFAEMSDQSKAFRQKLSERYYIAAAEIEQRLVSKLDGTAKYLLRLPDGEHVECVLMEYHHGYSICISTPGRVQDGLYVLRHGQKRLLPQPDRVRDPFPGPDRSTGCTVQRISNVVLMGMGEPLDNYRERPPVFGARLLRRTE